VYMMSVDSYTRPSTLIFNTEHFSVQYLDKKHDNECARDETRLRRQRVGELKSPDNLNSCKLMSTFAAVQVCGKDYNIVNSGPYFVLNKTMWN